MSNIGCLMGAFSWLMTNRVKYNKICAEPERKEKTVFFGVYSIIMSIAMAALVILCVWGTIACVDALDGNDLGLSELAVGAFILMLAICAAILLAEYIFGGLIGVVYQFRCNKRPIRWIALAVFIATAAGMIAGIILIFNATGVF